MSEQWKDGLHQPSYQRGLEDAKAQERAERMAGALGVLGGLASCDVQVAYGTLELSIEGSTDPWHSCSHNVMDLTPDDMDAMADALRTLAQCLREGGAA